MANLPFYGTAYAVTVHLYTSTGLITNPGTLTCKISKDYGAYGDVSGAVTEEDSTYGQIKVALDATDMTADHIDGYVIDDTSGCFAATFHIDTIPVVRGLAGTALPNAAADAAGGLPISDAGGLDLDTYIKRLEAAFTATIAGRIDENISAAKTLTSGERSTLAAAIEAALVNEGDATALLAAIADKISADWTAGDLSAVAIADAVRAELAIELARVDAAISTRAPEAGGNIAAILADTGTDGVVVAAGSKTGYTLTAAYDAAKTAAPAGAEMDLVNAPNATALAAVADKVLGRNIAGGSDGGRTVTSALRSIRNRIAIALGVMTVYAEDDTTPAWTGAVTTDASADPITEIDPA